LSDVASAKLLATGEKLTFSRSGKNVVLNLPDKPVDPIDTVVALEVKDGVKVDPLYVTNKADGSVTMTPADAYYDSHMTLTTRDGKVFLENWRSFKSTIVWDFKNKKAGKYKVLIDLSPRRKSALKGIELYLKLDGKDVSTREFGEGAELNKWHSVDFGTVSIPEGVHTVVLSRGPRAREKRNSSPLWIGQIRIVPADAEK